MNPPEGEEQTNQIDPTQATPEPLSSEGASLEGENLENNDATGGNTSTPASGSTGSPKDPKNSILHKIIALLKRFDIYFLIFILLIVVSLIVAYIAIQKNKSAKVASVSVQQLDQNAIKQINGNDTQVGSTNETLDIQSSTVFGGNVLVKNDLQVAGSLKVAGTLALPGITVSGITDLGQVNANTLTLTGAETVKGQLTVNQGLTVNGIASFGGAVNAATINVTNLQVNGDMTFSHHIYTSGSIPRATTGGSTGSGGTSSVNGSDTSGNVNVSTGTGASPGCLVNIAFAQSYTTTPYIEITPVGAASGNNIGLYITRSTSGFSICANNPPSGASMSFDYYVTG